MELLGKYEKVKFEEFYKEYFKIVFLYVRRFQPENAEDITQDIFVKLFLEYSRNPRLLQKNHLTAFVKTTTRNFCIDYDRKKRNKKNIKVMELNVDLHNGPILCEEQNQFEKNDTIALAFNNLTNEQKGVFLLLCKGLSYKEIGEKLNIGIGAVRNRICRGRKILKRYFSS